MTRLFNGMITQPIRNNLSFFLFLFLFGGTCIIFEPWNGSRILGLIELFLDLYVLCVFLMIFPKIGRKYIKVIVSFILYFIGLIDMWCYHVLHMPITASLFQVLLQTNKQESQEAIRVYWDSAVLFSPFGLLILIATIHVIVSIFGLMKKNETINKLLLPLWNKKGNIVLSIILCLCFIVSLPDKERLFTSYIFELSPEDIEKKEIFFNVNTRANMYLPIYRFYAAIKDIHHFNNEIVRLPIIADQTQVDSCAFTSPIIVLIIGESYNRHHSELYGYSKATTPFQKKRLDKNEIYLFKDVVSAWNLTSLSFQDMFSLKTQNSPGEWYDYPLFTTMFRRAGYDVSFLSNQYVLSLEGRLSDFVEDLFLNEAHMSNIQFSHRNKETHNFDIGLLADYDSLTHTSQYKTSIPQLTIFHFRGLHAAFNERFPKQKAFFSANDYQRRDLTPEDLQILADYDNAMRYNDEVIEGILSRMENKEAIVINLADHGERIFDYGTTNYGRSMALTQESICQQYEIPFWIWCSSSYKEKHPEIVQQIISSQQKPWITSNLPHLMLFLAGISNHKYYQSSANILSPDAKCINRIISGKYLYTTSNFTGN